MESNIHEFIQIGIVSLKLVMLLALSNASRASDQASPAHHFQQFTPKVYVSSS